MTTARLTHSLSSIQRAEADGRRPSGFTKVCLDHAAYDSSTGLVTFTMDGWLAVNQWVRNQSEGRAPARPHHGLGDLVGSIATPIARALHMSCIDPATGQLHPDSRCQKRKDALNKIRILS
jgi:hypothetical protein